MRRPERADATPELADATPEQAEATPEQGERRAPSATLRQLWERRAERGQPASKQRARDRDAEGWDGPRGVA